MRTGATTSRGPRRVRQQPARRGRCDDEQMRPARRFTEAEPFTGIKKARDGAPVLRCTHPLQQLKTEPANDWEITLLFAAPRARPCGSHDHAWSLVFPFRACCVASAWSGLVAGRFVCLTFEWLLSCLDFRALFG
ncbi:hypothetical protein GQ55_9G536700 [Panicum hallii var. hallii]|uniref:Uncharacterized protein n=1 Tax=Panicum hallii var. hallii TaxID=1504633 RepID=A0A2T7CES1_9POAL|nr:hypothetical protein GQ55_9G536700 [Panicum hallii var. hallii]